MTKQWTVHPHRTSPHQDRPIGLLDGTTLFPEAALPSGFRSSPNWADFETLSKAPNFSLSTTPDQKVSLSDLRGQPVVLVFYPADWSPVCSDQLGLYNELKPEFSEF